MECFSVPLWTTPLEDIAPEKIIAPWVDSPVSRRPLPLPAPDGAAFPAKESDRCHSCNRHGHWAKDCRSQRRVSPPPRFRDRRYQARHMKPSRLKDGKGRRVFIS